MSFDESETESGGTHTEISYDRKRFLRDLTPDLVCIELSKNKLDSKLVVYILPMNMKRVNIKSNATL